MFRSHFPGRHRAAAPATRRGLALVILCAASLMVILDGTIVTVALPEIVTVTVDVEVRSYQG